MSTYEGGCNNKFFLRHYIKYINHVDVTFRSDHWISYNNDNGMKKYKISNDSGHNLFV